ncbi:hypothetical protein LWC34_23235 [Kibdelosporangium philippinense]|uniref:Dnd system-associated protein 4 n=1 Tax=Kibdelosporangium philippinense TaxID=211113 RepID=A0ABS8ZDU7_9PSEU|nr:hypothetical protein [Kibdelosporangium philippinense]MCE7005717.1 hypothetical protein [Kibdelosporangium philippinense]
MADEQYEYFLVYARTYKMLRTLGGPKGLALNLTTGDFEPDTKYITQIMFATTQEIFSLDEEEFIRETEEARKHFLSGDGPIFALYEVVDGIYAQARAEGRRITPDEIALIDGIFKRTFKMWDEEFARRRAGEPGANTYTSKAIESSSPSGGEA